MDELYGAYDLATMEWTDGVNVPAMAGVGVTMTSLATLRWRIAAISWSIVIVGILVALAFLALMSRWRWR